MLSIKNEIISATARLLATQLWEQSNTVAGLEIKKTSSDTPPLPGKYWIGHGGVYLGIMREADSYWHLILAVNAVAIFKGAWGPNDIEIPGASSFADGFSNTEAMIKSGNEHPILSQLANFNQTGEDGHHDFYLPAQKENNLIYIAAPDQLDQVFHWSSTQYSASHAWEQDFEYGSQSVYLKDNERSARAVRRELII